MRALQPQAAAARGLAVVALVDALGSGVFLASNAVLLIKVFGLRPGQVGWGFSAAGLCGLTITLPAGRLADRYGARKLLVAAHVMLATAYVLFSLVDRFSVFLAVVCLVGAGEAAVKPLREALAHSALPPAQATQARAQLLGFYNLGFIAGSLAAVPVLVSASRSAFVAVCLVNALAQCGCVAQVWRVPLPQPTGSGQAVHAVAGDVPKERGVWRDRRLLALVLLFAVFQLDQVIAAVALPMWIVTRTSAPSGVNAVVTAVNALLVCAGLVVVARTVHSVRATARAQRRAGALLAVGCACYAVSSRGSAVVATALLVVGTVAVTFGEMLYTAARIRLSGALAPAQRQGEYLSAFALSRAVRETVGPVVVTSLVAGLGGGGWAVLGGMFAATGVFAARAARQTANDISRPSAGVLAREPASSEVRA
ncbi:MFS transporter [Streptomyces sp. NPDC005500]|uniref:MFS transporter n=1 Tax=Streptomyces sp. NPDC005500 TaxID=3155007 RepID=UPI0033A22E72